MKYTKAGERYILKIEKGELVHETIRNFCDEHTISNALIHGIGAVEWVRCGYYDLPNQKYLFTEYDEIVEVASYSGNVMIKEESLFVHAHGVFSDDKNQVWGGHVDEMRVGVVLEVVLTPLSTQIERTYDTEIGLYLMQL